MSICALTRPCATLLIVASIPLLTADAFAQPGQPQAGVLTLEEALRLAEATSETVAAASAGVRRAEAEQDRARSGLFPQANALVSYDRALASEFSGIFDSSAGPACDPFAPNPAAPVDARLAEIERAISCGAVGGGFFGSSGDGGSGDGDSSDNLNELPFGRENTWRFSLNISQAVYTGGRLGALRDIAAAGRESSELAVVAARGQVLFDVTQAYFDAVLSDRLVEIAQATVDQADATLRQVQAAFDAGAQPEFEVLRARVNRDNQQPALIRQRAARDVAHLRLKQLVQVAPTTPLQLADRLTDVTLPPPQPFAEALAKMRAVARPQTPERTFDQTDVPDVGERNAVREAAALVRAREATLDAARAERRPSVSASSSFAQIAYPSGPFPTGDFRTNWTIGASLQMPILTGGRLGAEVEIARAELAASAAQLQQVEEIAALDTRAAWAELLAAEAAWRASGGTIEEAGRAYEIANVRFTSGVSTQLELADARLLLQQSETNRAQAARDLQVARARLALLPVLPLLSSGARTAPAATSTAPIPAQTTPSQLRNAATLARPSGGRQ